MKKFFIFAVMMLMSTAAQVFGAEFGFAEVARVAQAGNGFFAYTAGGEAVSISAYQYMQMKDADGYYILNVDGKKVVAAGDEFVVEKLTVDSVGLDGSQPKVFFTNGTAKTFTKSDWLKAIKGQTVRLLTIDTPTWRHTRYSALADGATVTPHSKTAPVKKAAAPAAQATPAAPAAQAAPAAPARSNSPVKFTIE